MHLTHTYDTLRVAQTHTDRKEVENRKVEIAIVALYPLFGLAFAAHRGHCAIYNTPIVLYACAPFTPQYGYPREKERERGYVGKEMRLVLIGLKFARARSYLVRSLYTYIHSLAISLFRSCSLQSVYKLCRYIHVQASRLLVGATHAVLYVPREREREK